MGLDGCCGGSDRCTGLNFIAYLTAAWAVNRNASLAAPSRKGRWWAAWFLWLAAWLAGWRWAIITMLIEYAKLPTTNPNCYLSNAAAFAHPRLTGAVRRGEVTACMQRLKFIELAFRAALPGVHHLVRRQYDLWCPPLAERCRRHVWLATLTCIGLWPVEFVAEALRFLLRIDAKLIHNIYRPTPPLAEGR